MRTIIGVHIWPLVLFVSTFIMWEPSIWLNFDEVVWLVGGAKMKALGMGGPRCAWLRL